MLKKLCKFFLVRCAVIWLADLLDHLADTDQEYRTKSGD